MSLITNTNTSFQWMTSAGVNSADVKWLELMNGSPELHMPALKQRVEEIYTAALDGMLSSTAPVEILMQSLN